ncbi:hypothetical protein B0H15DRAFT_826047 [Mycena belliarum]|uniref:N-acetyltransferase domain-containing protein n=1 Tax=Mycena belliarum TaxID=1033014 RepID=A0AAD6XY74_9AGAR|nr:hypothetical protein B0H15DRAFT_826047 [Mycena belliae]
MPDLAGGNITVSDGLKGFDYHFETLVSLWETLQLCALDSAAQPECDLLSFSQSAFLLGVITRNASLEEKENHPLDSPHIGTADFEQSSRASQRVQPAETDASACCPHRTQLNSVDDDLLEELVGTVSELSRLLRPNRAWDPISMDPEEKARDDRLTMKKVMEKSANTKRTSDPASFRFESSTSTNIVYDQREDIHPTLSLPRATRFTDPPAPPNLAVKRFEVSPRPYYDSEASSGVCNRPLPPDQEPRDGPYAVKIGSYQQPIGLIYLATTPLVPSPLDQVGELNLGIILSPEHRGKGYAREAIQLAVKYAFDVRHCHRIQASLLPSSSKDCMVSLLTRMRFGHEGTKRSAFFNPMTAEWQDVTTLALLDTSWAMRRFIKAAPKSLWDELFLRHERERDELLRWEETHHRLKRPMTSSMETLHATPLSLDGDPDSDAASSTYASKGKRRALSGNQDLYDEPTSDADSGCNDRVFLQRASDAESQRSGASSPALSDASFESIPRSVTTTSSDWDMFESSSSGSSNLGELD